MAKKTSQRVPPPIVVDKFTLSGVDPVEAPKFAEGEVRDYLVTTPSSKLVRNRSIDTQEYAILFGLLIVACVVRLYALGFPNSVVFDEVHFGKFAAKYIKKEFFMDVHPPLAKMLYGWVGQLGGYDGEFPFKTIGDPFPPEVPYYLMRLFPAVLGVGTVLFCYLTLRNSGVRPLVALFTLSVFLIENSSVTLSRYILLDSPLMFFIAFSIWAYKKFEFQKPFTSAWFTYLVLTGVGLGLSFSSKWVGLFTIAWVGASCVYQVWFIIGDLSVTFPQVVAHLFYRGFILLGVPLTMYLGFFAIHFNILTKDNESTALLTSAFKASLENNNIPKNMLALVGLGSVVTIKHLETFGGYLHSHNHFYPTGSKQQQITLYPHIDHNNKWVIEPYNLTIPEDEFVPLTNGMKIRLKHASSGRRLHSHDEKPPVSERDWQKEASCYGYDGFPGDANDDFVVEIVQKRSQPEARHFVRPIQTIFRLKHAMTGTYLFSSEVKLPDWGFKQQEVTTASQGARPLTYWYIEENTNERIPAASRTYVDYPKFGFWEKFLESHKRMWIINNGLTGHHNWQSSPQSWPLFERGINYWVHDHRQVYLFGNIPLYYAVTAALVTFVVHVMISVLRWQTGRSVATNKNVFNFNSQVFGYTLGWILHFFPFFIMGRQLFIHHYLPAFYFGVLVVGHFFELIVDYICVSPRLRQMSYVFFGLFFAASVFFYYNYSSLIYGTPWTKKVCNNSKLISTWDFECNAFFDTPGEYSNYTMTNIYMPTVTKTMTKDAPKPSAVETVFVKQAAPGEDQEELVQAALQEAAEKKSAVQAAAGEKIEEVKENVEEVKDEVKAKVEEVKEKVEEVKEAVPEVVEEVKENVEKVKEAVPEVVQEVKGKIEGVPEAVEQVVEAVPEAVEHAKKAVHEAIENVKEAVPEAIKQAKESVHEAVEQAKPVKEEAAEEVLEVVPEAAEEVLEEAQATPEISQAIDEHQELESPPPAETVYFDEEDDVPVVPPLAESPVDEETK